MSAWSIDRITQGLSGAMWTFSSVPDDNSAATFVHRCFRRESWREAGFRERTLMYAALPFVPFVTLVLAIVFTALNGRAIKKQTRKGIIRQVREQVEIALQYAILPPWYYIFELHDDDKRQRASEYINRFEVKSCLYRILRDYNGGLPIPAERSTSCIKDKLCFLSRCRKFSITTAPVFLIVSKGKIKSIDWRDSGLPETDLFVKPLQGENGRNAARWDYLGSGQYRRNDGKHATAEEVLESLCKASWRRSFLVQPRLINHREVADLANGALATVRVMSCRNERGEFEATNAVFRMPQNETVVVDNFHRGGVAASIDLHIGELGNGTCGAWGFTGEGWYERHHKTGVQILRRKLPCWTELLDLVRHAHESAFSDQVVIGWDVALLDSGPCMMGINKAPDLDMIQRIGRCPLGNERFGKLLAFNLKRTIEAMHEPF
ncbi:MAG TPA: sugar-transfer associated ATP-grasp domain-containing protein [Nitrosospira sp.]|nr:sugar-transfer associated ATP-grasp domain-containing protein [Nitrosospira sp.]